MKKIHIIINPASGSDYPILSLLNRKLQGSDVDWDIFVTKTKEDIRKYTRRAVKKGVDAVAVYGGDGSMMEALQELYKNQTPLIILPGGTANILAKELMIPTNVAQAADLLTKKQFVCKWIDMGICNKRPFLLRVNIGLSADIVIHADPSLKQSIGQIAYPISAMQKIGQSTASTYHMKIDGKKIVTEGISLIVANSGNIGFSGVSLLPEMDVTDGKLDIFLLKSSDFGYLATVAKETLIDRKKTTLDHWKGKKIYITMIHPRQSVLVDDDTMKANRYTISVVPKALPIVVR